MVVLLYCVWLSVYDCVRLCTIVYCLWLYTGVLCLAVTVWRDWGVCVTVLVCKCVWLCVFDCVFGCVLLCVLVIHIVCVTVCVWWVLWHSGCDFQFRCFRSFQFQPTFPLCAANDNYQWSSGSSSSSSSSGGSCSRFHVDAALLSLLGANQGARSNRRHMPRSPDRSLVGVRVAVMKVTRLVAVIQARHRRKRAKRKGSRRLSDENTQAVQRAVDFVSSFLRTITRSSLRWDRERCVYLLWRSCWKVNPAGSMRKQRDLDSLSWI